MKTPKKPKTKIPAGAVFQFKITLQGIEPPIWRRIQTKDCTGYELFFSSGLGNLLWLAMKRN